MSVPPELLYDIIAYIVTDYIDDAITTPPTSDRLRIQNLLDEERKLREAGESKKALRQAYGGASASDSGKDGAGKRDDSEHHRKPNTTADDDGEWPTYNLANLFNFYYLGPTNEENNAALCETWEMEETKEPLPENNIIHLLCVSRLFRDTAFKVLDDTLDVQHDDPGRCVVSCA